MRRTPIVGLSAVYVLALAYLTLVPFPQPSPTPNLVPMRTVVACCRASGWSGAVNLAGNLVLMAPVGVLVALLRPGRHGARTALLAGGLLSLAVELAQFASGRRTADVDDLLLNAAGAVLSYLTIGAARRATAGVVGLRAAPVR